MKKKDKLNYYKFLNSLPKKINKLYFGKLIGKFKLNNKSSKKNGFDPVTNIDRALELFLRKEITKRFPSDGIIGEEFKAKKTKNGFSWILDPIDGTRSFVIGSPTWSNLISVNYKGNPIFGLANFPMLNKYYYNQSPKIAYVVENKKRKKISVNKSVKFKDIKLTAGFHGAISLNQQKKIPKLIKLIQFPCSDALSYAQICEGRIDVVLQCNNKIWDIHPLIPIINASGGITTTWKNKDAKQAGHVAVSSNKIIHKKILGLLKPIV